MRVLLAENDYMIRQFLTTMLNHYGEVLACQSGREAVKQYSQCADRHQWVDLACLEINLPDKSGLDVLRGIRKLEQEYQAVNGFHRSKILMMTSKADKSCVVEAIEHGCDGFLLKPIEKESFFKKLNDMGIRIVA